MTPAIPRIGFGLNTPPAASDAISGSVAGLPRDKRRKQSLAMLQAYVDDSGTGNPPVFVLAGVVASAGSWAKFADEWDEALKKEPTWDRLKMKLYMKMDPWRDPGAEAKLSKLYELQQIINKYVEYGVCIVVPTHDYREVFGSGVPKIWRSEYHFTANMVMSTILNNEYRLGRTKTVDFIFDHQMGQQESLLLAFNRARRSGAPAKARRRMGSLTFGSDDVIRPLQAADMFAWLRRKMVADMLGDAGVIQPDLKGQPLYDSSILNMGRLEACAAPERDEWTSPAELHAFALRVSSKAWPGGMNFRIPTFDVFCDKQMLIQARSQYLGPGKMSQQSGTGGVGKRRQRPQLG